MVKLPDVIAGPILRRVTENRVCVWLASSKKLNLKLSVHSKQSTCIGNSGKGTSQQLGKHLWVSLFEAWPAQGTPFPKDELLYYQLEDTDTNQPIDLQAVSLDGHASPSFFIPTKLNVIAHGSCRKPHGKALSDKGKELHIDALSLLSGQLDKNSTDFSQRPALLCLTGDQIYADDVAAPLMNLLKEKAIDLMGGEIGVPEIEEPSLIEPNARMKKLKKVNSGLTSTHAHNHLISFGEYAAMYLYVFGNGSNWELKEDNSNDGENDKDKNKRQDELERLQAFSNTLPNVRKALANIPTYMMFDDHEISDDWNITRNWYDGVRNSPCGRRIVSNGLATYWAFQGWGNAPEAFNREFIRSIDHHLKSPKDPLRAERFDLQMWKHRGWGFTVPSSPPVIAMDCRTQRDFDANNSPARLMDRYALDWLRIAWVQLKSRKVKGAPIIISGSPVMGFDPIEKAQWVAKFGGVKATDLDLESWIANKQGLSYFMDTLLLRMSIKQAIFISGDVHYSFVNRAKYESAGKRLNVIQLTSSALHNSPNTGRYLDWLAQIDSHTERHKGIRPTGNVPWYKFWLPYFRSDDKKYPIWKTTITGIQAEGKDRLVTNRPNIALVYFNNGKPTKQRLISGKSGDYCLDFKL